MSACSDIDITQEQKDSLLKAISILLSSDYSPQTIINYVCADVGLPVSGETNWCLLTCISSCVYKYTTFINPSSFVYSNKNTIYTCVTDCFPVFPSSNPNMSGGAAPSRTTDIENLAKWKAEQIKNVDKETLLAIEWLIDILIRAFIVLAITCESFSNWIAMLATHLTQITLADITKKIGYAIEEIAKAMKKTIDLINASVNLALTSNESQTDEGKATTGHETKAAQDALTIICGFFTDIIRDMGRYIEESGEFSFDVADATWDMSEISFASASFGSQVAEINSHIAWTFKRIDETIFTSMKTKEDLNIKYADQIVNKVDQKSNLDSFNSLVENSSSDSSEGSSSMTDVMSSVLSINSGVAWI